MNKLKLNEGYEESDVTCKERRLGWPLEEADGMKELCRNPAVGGDVVSAPSPRL